MNNHVELTTLDGNITLKINGIDVTRNVLRRGFNITPTNDNTGHFDIHLTLRAHSLYADLDDATITTEHHTTDSLAANNDDEGDQDGYPR